jgi:hypothetical protein
MENSFQSFKAEELLAWKLENRLPEKGNLVRPTGSLNSPIAHRLHQPSLTTQQSLECDSETADLSNGCTAMIMGNGFRSEETLIYDHLHRRCAQSRGLEEYPGLVLQTHENFTYRVMESSAAKVEIIYGKQMETRLIRDPNMHLSFLPLWADYTGIVLCLVHEDSTCFSFHDANYHLRKILLFAVHPQRLFYRSKGDRELIRQDKILEVAVLMVDPATARDPHYYQEKKLGPRSHQSTMLLR